MSLNIFFLIFGSFFLTGGYLLYKKFKNINNTFFHNTQYEEISDVYIVDDEWLYGID